MLLQGRYNVVEIKRMLEHITVHNLSAPTESRIITSVELEKTRRDIGVLTKKYSTFRDAPLDIWVGGGGV